MKKNRNSNISYISGSLANKCLVAMPQMSDSRFEKTVIYICSDSEEEGTMGFVINKPLVQFQFRTILDQLKVDVPDEFVSPRIFSGGPVDVSRGFVLHSLDYKTTDTATVSSHLGLSATVDILKAIALGQGPQKSLIALGYASWKAGQLEAEIAGNSWFVFEPKDDLIFDCRADKKWGEALKAMGVNPLMLSLNQGSV